MPCYKFLCISLGFILGTNITAVAQNKPGCLTEKQTGLYTKQLIATLKLADNRTVYKIRNSVQAKCMDCNRGVSYIDSNCVTVASFGIGNAPYANIANGYKETDFLEAGLPPYKGVIERSKLSVVFKDSTVFFAKADTFKINGINKPKIKGFLMDDELQISNAEGLKHYRKGKLVNSYKIIPRRVTIGTISKRQNYYYLGSEKKFIKVARMYYATNLLLSVEQHDENLSDEALAGIKWELCYYLK